MTETIAAAPGVIPDQVAARVLRTEGEAILALSRALPPDFVKVVDLILACTGRVIVSGMGKSGHVGRKIAATLASTGTLAFFVHPAEASHGDLGMIAPGDVCLLLSNSGETAELGDILAHCARFGIPMIGMSKNAQSTLMQAAQLRLTLPDLPEACAIGMAPTTSTTLTLALGDALAVALMEARAFRPDQFRTYHPGGKLGARLARVAQLMHRGDALPLVAEDMAMPEVILVMTSKGFGMAGVVDAEGRLTGAISDGDLRRNLHDLMGRRARDVATPNPVTVRAETLAAEALAILNQRKIGALMVVDDAMRPLGIVHLHDCLRAGVA
jgi:arabinose-5-phosphate isomerase